MEAVATKLRSRQGKAQKPIASLNDQDKDEVLKYFIPNLPFCPIMTQSHFSVKIQFGHSLSNPDRPWWWKTI